MQGARETTRVMPERPRLKHDRDIDTALPSTTVTARNSQHRGRQTIAEANDIDETASPSASTIT
jgi:hypothetical protein